jgi:hypothetical protein
MIDMSHALTVAQLIEKLSELPQDRIVVQSKDAEGNGFSPFSEATLEDYVAESTWAGELIAADEDPEDYDDVSPAVVLWPVN